MRKILVFLILCLMVPVCVLAAHINIDDLSYTEKVDLYEQLTHILDDTFILPPGIYEVGKDIKAGTYRFMYDINCDWYTTIRIGDEVNISKTDLKYDRQKFTLYDPYWGGYYFQLTEAYYRLKKGDFIVVEYNDVRVQPMDKELTW